MDSDVADASTGPDISDSSPGPINAPHLWLLAVSLVIIIIDQGTKIWALETLPGNPIEGPFGSAFRLVFNRGSAFSLGEGFGPLFGILAIVISIALLWVVRSVNRRIVVIGLGLVQGGAIGNVIDLYGLPFTHPEGDLYDSGTIDRYQLIGDRRSRSRTTQPG